MLTDFDFSKQQTAAAPTLCGRRGLHEDLAVRLGGMDSAVSAMECCVSCLSLALDGFRELRLVCRAFVLWIAYNFTFN